MTALNQAYIGFGSNLGNSQQHVNQAMGELNQYPGIRVQKQSAWYQSQAIGPSQPDYINGAALINTSLTPENLLDALQTIEQQHDRIRTERWGPRTLDLDLLLFNDTSIQSERLTVPHKEIANRSFVLKPLLDINPELRLPDGRLVADILNIIGLEGLVELPSEATGVRFD